MKRANATNKNLSLNNKILAIAKKPNEETLAKLNSSSSGLTPNFVEKNKDKYGKNAMDRTSSYLWYHSLFNAVINPFSLILIIIAILDIVIPKGGEFSPDWPCFGIAIGMLVISCSIKMFQEIRSNKASEKLHNMIETTTAVEREGKRMEIPLDEVVVGDIVHLASGDIIPADLKIIYAKDFFISQSALTGENEPIEKFANYQSAKSALECRNICFMGTTVATGSAQGVVIGVGQNTMFGNVSAQATKKRPATSFDKGIRNIGLLLLITTAIMVTIIYVVQGSIGKDWMGSLSFALALAIGLTPEMLPVIVTVNLAKEAFRLSKQKTIVKNIASIQSFGAMDVLCSDKTGTLTEDRIVLEKYLNIDGKEDRRVLMYAYFNSFFQTGLKNLIDKAIISKAEKDLLVHATNAFRKIDEIPFDFNRRRMSVVIQSPNKMNILITKGALEEMLAACSFVEINGKTVSLSNKIKDKIRNDVRLLNESGMRVVAIATNTKTYKDSHQFTVNDEENLKLLGYVALLDPPKLSAAKAIKELQQKGVEVKVLTGDNEYVAKYICSAVGLKGKKIITGNELYDMSDEKLQKIVMQYTIFARLSPEQKVRVVKAIKKNKHVVGFMGDGINDAPAMRAADISISVDTAVDIAKECADVILLEKDLTILSNGCVEGRKTYANIIKYIKMTISSNFGNMLSMLIASIWLTKYGIVPMAPEQILILNLLYDFAQIAMPWDNVDEDFYNKPRNWRANSILRFMLVMGPISSIFDIATFLIMFFALKWNNNSCENLFQTGWFLESLLTQTIVIIVLRSNKFPFHKTSPSLFVVLSLTLLFLVGIILTLVPGLEPIFTSLVDPTKADPTNNFVHPEIIGYIFLLGIGYVGLAQCTKVAYVKIFKDWL